MNQIGKEYEARDSDYENQPGSRNKPKKGPPEKKSEVTIAKETDHGNDSDNSSNFFRNANMGPDWDGSRGDVNATETDSEPSEYAMSDKENETKKGKVEKGTGCVKTGITKLVKKKVGGGMEKEKNGTKLRTSPRLRQRNSARQAEAVSAKGAREKRKSFGGDNKGSAKKAKK